MNGNGDAADERPMNFVYNNWQGNQCDLYGMFGINDNLEHRVVIDGKVFRKFTVYSIDEVTNTNDFVGVFVMSGNGRTIYRQDQETGELTPVKQ